MTPEQKERIRAAARELSAALTDAGDEFSIDTNSIEVTTLGDKFRRYAYSFTINATTREVVA